MNFNHQFFFFFALFYIQLITEFVFPSESESWSYSGPEDGAAQWCKLFPTCCGKTQSPIDLPATSKKIKLQDTFKFTDYDKISREMSLINNGHSVLIVNLDRAVRPKFTGGLLNKTYKFHSVHFHWGENSPLGSEHSVTGKKFPLEMHLVHYSNQYNNINQALTSNRSDAVAALGVLFTIDKEKNNSILAPLFDKLNRIHFIDETTILKNPFNLSSLLPSNTGNFYRYNGSLTTPPCYESVIWTVFEATQKISEIQMTILRKLFSTSPISHSHTKIINNFRPIQEINGRTVVHFT